MSDKLGLNREKKQEVVEMTKKVLTNNGFDTLVKNADVIEESTRAITSAFLSSLENEEDMRSLAEYLVFYIEATIEMIRKANIIAN